MPKRRPKPAESSSPPKSKEAGEVVARSKLTQPRQGSSRGSLAKSAANAEQASTNLSPRQARLSSLIDTRVVYCGDNLEQLAKLPDKCIDLIYIDPPFNSNRNYEVFWGETKEKRSFEDRHASTQAYIDYMRPRCQQLSRVLKKTGSFYYHCDWHASHYVKVMLDQLFGENYFQNDIVWKRTTAHTDSNTRFGHVTDNIFFYAGSERHLWNPQYREHNEKYLKSHYGRKDANGRQYRLDNIIRSASMGPRPNLVYEYMGFTPEWGWRTVREKLQALDKEGRLQWAKSGTPYLVRYLDEQEGELVDNIWDDIPPVNSQAQERLGYPTQKPLALLERIIKASSNPNDIVLDAFCGCGTALVAAQNLGRQWIGIDISPTACRVMAKRLRDVCKLPERESLWLTDNRKAFVVKELPYSVKQLRTMPHFEFENWAVIALGGIPNKVQVGDMGIDGRIFPVGTKPSDANSMFAGDWFPIQVKQSEKVGRPDIDAFEAAMHRDDRVKGFMLAFSFTSDAHDECASFYRKTKRLIKLLTVQEILDEQHVQKM